MTDPENLSREAVQICENLRNLWICSLYRLPIPDILAASEKLDSVVSNRAR